MNNDDRDYSFLGCCSFALVHSGAIAVATHTIHYNSLYACSLCKFNSNC